MDLPALSRCIMAAAVITMAAAAAWARTPHSLQTRAWAVMAATAAQVQAQALKGLGPGHPEAPAALVEAAEGLGRQ